MTLEEKVDKIYEALFMPDNATGTTLLQEVTALRTALFMSNGKPSIVARLNSVERLVGWLVKLDLLIAAPVLTAIIGLLVLLLTHQVPTP